ncbi:hypothetical protein KAFR_0K02260 [Kazachstania africana CBS 2517]|uniref:Methyltransferase type 12 domain-containing protein n=1 Tax=Kazachstania africana (strain ATCC 22294 / BCRC 22015 / CBS 2517 / CECT 1963 / NBRC 1671 / NRRL Y-8276) TaxID=1071382 RepID=H2B1T0_KAZAF|nr:hypothetical protein KAFR_0K02260 [Kazachstania africana CBS 2517]CCF60580.1 hypothetical protein KAFR_0K02260 [Kazachstania africana CBS 2517]
MIRSQYGIRTGMCGSVVIKGFVGRAEYVSQLTQLSQIGHNTQVRYIARGSTCSKSPFLLHPNVKVRKPKTKEELAEERFNELLHSKNRFIRWGAFLRTESFNKNLTKFLFVLYGIFLVYGYYYMKRLYVKDHELRDLLIKQEQNGTNEYENLRIKQLQNKLRTRDSIKLARYEKLIEEDAIKDFDGIELENVDQNKENTNILPARDTTPFYEIKAAEYDKGINFEEKMIGMGRRRKWLMKHCKGDVLEVACGTGRNIKYVDIDKINSITFLDSSKQMMEIAHKRFRDRFPTFKKAAFVVGRAENLLELAQDNSKFEAGDVPDTKVKYDTIIEAFGLCSHEDPLRALNNFTKLLKPDGRIILLEHGRGDKKFINKILDKRAAKRLETWGCRWNLDIGELLDDSGLDVVKEERSHMGTTWCIVAKRKCDVKRQDEIGFFEKYIKSSVDRKIQSITDNNNSN